MRYYRCKCGAHEAWGSLGPNPCTRCKKCGSDLAGAPTSHAEARPHCMVVTPVTAEIDDGQKEVGSITRCIWCLRTLKQITDAGEPFEYRAT